MSAFTRAELLALEPRDLADLLKMADGDTPELSARALGLDISDPADRKAVIAAVEAIIDAAEPGGPVVGAGQLGVRSDLTPKEPAIPCGYCGDHHPGEDRHGEAEALGLPEPSPAAAADMAEILRASAGTGVPFLAGTFALYAAPDGSIVMVTETNTHGVRRDVIPRKAVKFALGMMAGKAPFGMGRLFGRG